MLMLWTIQSIQHTLLYFEKVVAVIMDSVLKKKGSTLIQQNQRYNILFIPWLLFPF